jgi:uncharacterized membrane protein YeaQ/YmgE (transglycosylase-associated protein family)
MSPFSWLIVGAIAGWLAGTIMRGRGFGCIGNVAIGLVGAFIGGYVFQALKIELGAGLFNEIITALTGAVILLAVANLLGGNQRR